MIQKLLSLGADPNSLAWERFGADIKRNQSRHKAEGNVDMEDQDCDSRDTRVTLHDVEFDTSLGFSPLHFIALGLRSPPRNSLSEGKEQRLIHDVCESYISTFLQLKGTNERRNPLQSAHELSPLLSPEKTDIASEIVESCIKLLLSAGANPNSGSTSFLRFYYPLDVIIQPPLRIYYASTLARASQSPESLCRQNFEFYLAQIIRATRTLLHGGSKLSHNFLCTYKWHIRLLDCFYSHRPQAVCSLVESLLFLGVFPCSSQTLEQLCTDDERGFCQQKYITKFLIDAVNIPAPESLVGLIFKSCPMTLLHLFVDRGQALFAQVGSSVPYLSVLTGLAIKEQLRPLKHICKLTILESIDFDVQSINLLPLPLPLLRDLEIFRYEV